jgi:uncharacterized protein (DUF433 family)
MKATLDAHIQRTPGMLGGKPHIAGHRIGVDHVAHWHLREGRSVDQIAEQFGLSHAAIHAALAYYYDHRDEIDTRTAADDAWVEDLKAKTLSKVRDKLNQSRPTPEPGRE